MVISETIFSAVFNILSIYIGFRIIRIFLSRKDVPVFMQILTYALVWGVNWTVYYVFNDAVLTITSLMGGMFIATILLYEGSLVRKILAVVSAMALGMASENIIWIVFGELSTFQINAALGSLFSACFELLIVIVLERCFKINKKDIISLRSYFNIIIVIAGSIILGEILVKLSGDDQTLAMFGLSIICLSDVSTYYIYDKINEVYLQKLERKAIKQRIEMYENQLEIMQQSQRNIRSLRHDIKNHLILLQTYIASQEYDKALQYIESINEYMVVSGQFIHTGNQEIDAILNYMIGKAQSKGCKVETQIQVPNECFISKMDLNVLLSNLLDNALEALERVEQRYLYISMKYQKGVFAMCIKNSYDGTLIKKGKKYITRKNDIENHGIGLQNVNEVIEKYNGEQIIETINGLYIITILLYVEAVH